MNKQKQLNAVFRISTCPKFEAYTYAEKFFSLKVYENRYKGIINHPCDDDLAQRLTPPNLDASDFEDEENDDEDYVVLPPSTRRPAGRPKNAESVQTSRMRQINVEFSLAAALKLPGTLGGHFVKLFNSFG